MRFPETTRKGSQGHQEALRRLDDAKTDRHHKHERHDAAESTSAARRVAAVELAAADEQVAAREAWVAWVERGY